MSPILIDSKLLLHFTVNFEEEQKAWILDYWKFPYKVYSIYFKYKINTIFDFKVTFKINTFLHYFF